MKDNWVKEITDHNPNFFDDVRRAADMVADRILANRAARRDKTMRTEPVKGIGTIGEDTTQGNTAP